MTALHQHDYEAYFGNDDATPQRVKRAHEAGLKTPVVDILLHTGMPSGAKRREIERPLDAALRRGWIDPHHKMAGEKLLGHMIGARIMIGYSKQKWQMPVDNSGSHDPSETKRFHEVEYRRAMMAIRSGMRDHFQDWLLKSEVQDTTVSELGDKFTEDKSRDSLRSVGKVMLQLILNDLSAHFGYISRPTAWQTRTQLETLLSRNRQMSY